MKAAFRYTARRYDGEAVTGTLLVESRDRAIAHLAGRALFVTSLRPIDVARDRWNGFVARIASDRSSRVAFMRSMAALISAGVALRRALEISTEQCADAGLREALRSIAADLDQGVALCDAVARRPREFPSIASALMRAGERAGALDEVFERLALWTGRERAVQNRIAAAVVYPAFVGVSAVAVLVLLIGQTVPALANMFAQMNLPLPLSTRFLLSVGHLARSPRAWVAGLLLGTATWGVATLLARSEKLAGLMQSTQLRLPLYGTLLKKRNLARFSRSLSMLLQCGVELTPALAICEGIMAHAAYRRALAAVRVAITEGQPFGSLFGGSLFDPLFVQLVQVGEESGSLDALLARLAEFYESDLDALIDGLSSLIEPALILVLGVAVGSIVAAVLVPFYSLLGSVR